MSKHQRTSSPAPWLVFTAVLAALALIAGGAFLFVRSRGDGGPLGPIASDSSYEVGLLDEPSSLDIRTNAERACGQALLDNVYQTLLTHGEDRSIAANLAARWNQSDDGLRYSFRLREGMTFADGAPLDASAVVASLQRTITDRHVGYEELGDVARVENPDDSSVVITLHKPNPRLLEALTGRAGVVYDTGARNADWAHASYGSGPFVVGSAREGAIELARNERYWGDKPAAARITLTYFDDEDAMVEAFADGRLDVALPRTAAAAASLAGNQSINLTEGVSTRKTLVALNSGTDSPFSDEQMRRIARTAIDAKGIARSQPDAKEELSGPISQLQPGYVDLDDLFPYDPAQAQAMTGYFAPGYIRPFTLLADEAHTRLAQRIVDELAAAALPVSLEVVDAATLARRFEAGDYACALVEMDDPDDYTRFADGDAAFGYQNRQVQDQYRTALAQTDLRAYEEQLERFDRMVSQDAASAWLYTGKDYVASGKLLQGLPTDLTSWRLPLAGLHG